MPPPSISMICSTISGVTTWKVVLPQTEQTTALASEADTPHFRQIEIERSAACSRITASASLVAAFAPFGM